MAKVWEKYKSSRGVQGMFAGIRPVVAGLVIGGAAVMVARASLQALEGGPMPVWALSCWLRPPFWASTLKMDPIKIYSRPGFWA